MVFVRRAKVAPGMHATTATEGFAAEWKPAMQATKAMKAAMKATKTKAMMAIAEQTELKPERVQAVFEALVKQKMLKKTDPCAILDLLTLKLKHKPRVAAKPGARARAHGRCMKAAQKAMNMTEAKKAMKAAHKELKAAQKAMMAAQKAMMAAHQVVMAATKAMNIAEEAGVLAAVATLSA